MNIWDSISLVNSGFTLAAFLAAVAAWVYRQKILEKEKLLRTAPEAKRAELVAAAMEFFHVDTRRLTKQQQFEIALQQIRARAQRTLWTTILIGIIAIVAAVTVFATTKNSVVTRPTTFFKIVDGETGDAVRCALTVEYVADGVPGQNRTVESRELGQFDLPGKVTITDVRGFDGYDFQRQEKVEVSDGRSVIKLKRNDRFADAILPRAFKVTVPTAAFDKALSEPDQPDPDQVKFECDNKTPYTVDLFFYRYFPPPKRPQYLSDSLTGPVTCPPGVTLVWDSFGTARGGAFSFFASVGGSTATRIRDDTGELEPAYVLNSLNPQLVLRPSGDWFTGEVQHVFHSATPGEPKRSGHDE
jgi:hypothetical protein